MTRFGNVYTETVVYSPTEAYVNDVPYQLAIVELEGGRRLTGRILGERVISAIAFPRRIPRRVPFFSESISMKLAERMSASAWNPPSRCWCARGRWRRKAATSSTWKSASRISIRRRTLWRRPSARSTRAGRIMVRTQGLPELREAIARKTSRGRAAFVGPEHVSVVPGGKPMIFFPMLALLEPGDEVIYPESRVPNLRIDDQLLGATPVPMPLVEERGFSFDLNLLRDKLSTTGPRW
jgi:hypothetical protein